MADISHNYLQGQAISLSLSSSAEKKLPFGIMGLRCNRNGYLLWRQQEHQPTPRCMRNELESSEIVQTLGDASYRKYVTVLCLKKRCTRVEQERKPRNGCLNPIRPPHPASPTYTQAGPGVDVLCKVRSRPCNKAVTVMTAQLKEEGDDHDDDARRAKRRRLAAFFVEPNPSTAAVVGEGGGGGSSVSSGEKEAPEVIVAIRKGNIVGTAFHPELTNDSRWHEYFVRIVKEAVSAGAGGVRDAESTTKTPAGAAAVAEAEVAVA